MPELQLITLKQPKSPVAEAYRTLRTNIQFSSIDQKVQSICITSAGPGEGKSTVAANLAIVMAEAGNKTILIDCDQRRSKMHKIFGVSNNAGLSDLLVGKASFGDAVQKCGVENLLLLTAGTRPPNPSELLASAKMKNFIASLREKVDIIIFDAPPVLMVTDAQLLSSYSDGYLLVVSSGEVDRKAAEKSKELLEKVNANIIGAVLNKLAVSEKGYYGYYYHYYYDADGVRHKNKGRKSLRTKEA